jgi:hypothetical protein
MQPLFTISHDNTQTLLHSTTQHSKAHGVSAHQSFIFDSRHVQLPYSNSTQRIAWRKIFCFGFTKVIYILILRMGAKANVVLQNAHTIFFLLWNISRDYNIFCASNFTRSSFAIEVKIDANYGLSYEVKCTLFVYVNRIRRPTQ